MEKIQGKKSVTLKWDQQKQTNFKKQGEKIEIKCPETWGPMELNRHLTGGPDWKEKYDGTGKKKKNTLKVQEKYPLENEG